ncbi:MAG TPA: RNase adapter RapZ [Gemmatimonadota bacterium]|jgi:aminoglycoside/choline kinase family phosphotransferase
MHDALLRLYLEARGDRPAAVVAVAGDGSQRTYHRLIAGDGSTLIGAFGPDADENRAFLSFSRAFRDIGLPVPAIHAVDETAGVWLEEDLGETTLFGALEEARRREGGAFPETVLSIYRRVLEILPRFQVEGDAVVDYAVAHPRPAFDRQSILWDLNYFKYHFLKLAHISFHEARLERDFDSLAEFLLEAPRDYFLYRDFQSRNVMVRDGRPWFIDYQGGRRGALQYDVASLLYDAKADLPEDVRGELLAGYLDALGSHLEVDRDAFRAHYRGFVLVRVMQALGAYGYRGFFERKPRFLQSVPYAAANIRRLVEEGLPVVLPELERAFAHIVDDWAAPPPSVTEGTGLTVQVESFSYRRGYPEDAGGHGGGFVFDCRALPNPGRLEEYRTATGRSESVARYLEAEPGLVPFWEHVRALVEAHVEEYRARGFTSLSIAFGCTGGQHRSVYLAERLARHIESSFADVRVRLSHREEPYWPAAEADRPAAASATWMP